MTAHTLRGPLHNVGFCPLLLAFDIVIGDAATFV